MIMKTPINIASMLGMLALLGGLTIPGLAFAVHPCVDIVKQVSADGGMTWHDANTEADAVSVSHGAIYQFTVKRCDYDGLYEVLVMDDLLGIAQPLNPFLLSNNNWNKELGQWTVDLNAEAQTFTVEAPDICDGYTGTLANTATVTATGPSKTSPIRTLPGSVASLSPAGAAKVVPRVTGNSPNTLIPGQWVLLRTHPMPPFSVAPSQYAPRKTAW